jgi:hypothetical protein
MIVRRATLLVFICCILLSLASLAVLLAAGTVGLVVVAASVLANLGAILISERKGFSKTTQLRRAFEPSRHFNSAQVGAIVLLVMVQVTLGLYVLLSA